MKQISGNCIIPFGLWGDDSPDHLITSIGLIDDIYIVTGDKLGQMIVWHIESDDKIYPIWYLLGHSGSISTLAISTIAQSNDRYVISVSNNREIGVWNCTDGRCLRIERHLAVEHTSVKAYRSSNSKAALLVCCGHYAGIQVLDSMTLKQLFCLQSRAHSDWVRSICVFPHKHREMDVVLGLSISGAITMWTIESMEGLREDNILFETESKMLMLTSSVSISICPSKPRIIMVLATTCVQIYDAATWSLLSEYECSESCFVSGWFLNSETILLRQRNGQCRLYYVPMNASSEPNSPNNLRPMGCLECSHGDIVCESVSMKDHHLTVVAGGGSGMVYLWKLDAAQLKDSNTEMVLTTDSCSLKEKWTEMDMASLVRPFKDKYTVTCCHCEPSIDSVMMGTSCGDILVMDLLLSVSMALFSPGGRPVPYTVLRGHTKAVLSLRYARAMQELEKSNETHTQWLWSGSEDFSVRLWSLDTHTCVSVFHCHVGPVTTIEAGPPLGLTKTKHEQGRITLPPRKTSVDTEHQEVLRPVNPCTWFGHRLYLSMDSENGVAFLSLETRRVVLHLSLWSSLVTVGWRRDHVSVALRCVEGTVTVWDLGSGLLDRTEEGQLAEDVIEACTDHTKVGLPPPILAWVASAKDRVKMTSSLAPLLVQPMILGHGRCGQVLLCDTETLLVAMHRHTSTDTHKTRLANQPITAQGQSHDNKSLLQAQLLLSLVNEWGVDSCLDSTLQSTVGLMRPPRSVCHGHVNTRTKTISFILARHKPHTDPVGDSLALLSGVSLCHAVNNLPDSLLHASWPRLSSFVNDSSTAPTSSTTAIDNRTEVRQVCCFFATSMAIGSLSKLLLSSSSSSEPGQLDMTQVPLIIESFLQKYQDRCLEIREAARTLMHAALDLLSPEQKHNLVQFWSLYGRVISKKETGEIELDSTRSHSDGIKVSKSLSSIYEAPSVSDWRHWVPASTQQRATEVDQLQATALSFLGIVGCRYGSPDVHLSPASNAVSASLLRSQPLDKALRGFGLDDYRLARTTCKFLMGLLTSASSSIGPGDGKSGHHWSTMRCLAITLLGQGFPVWEPYLEISMLLTKLLETVAPAERVLSGWTQGQILTDEMDAVHSARASLHAIALARPKVFATTLSIEVLRLQTQPSQGAMTTTSNIGGVAGGGTVSSTIPQSNGTQAIKTNTQCTTGQHQPPLLAARHEVVDVIKMLCEKKTREVHEVLPEIMDILLACLSKLDLRQYDLQQLFPPVLLFRIASSHTASGKVCVGTRTGHVSFYDVKIGKYNTSAGHGGPVTSVTFSPDGKQMASYSMPDNSVCIWQLFSSGLFGMGSSHQVKLASRLNVPPVAVSHTVTEEDSSLLLWLEWCDNKAIHLVTNAGLINKIKL